MEKRGRDRERERGREREREREREGGREGELEREREREKEGTSARLSLGTDFFRTGDAGSHGTLSRALTLPCQSREPSVGLRLRTIRAYGTMYTDASILTAVPLIPEDIDSRNRSASAPLKPLRSNSKQISKPGTVSGYVVASFGDTHMRSTIEKALALASGCDEWSFDLLAVDAIMKKGILRVLGGTV